MRCRASRSEYASSVALTAHGTIETNGSSSAVSGVASSAVGTALLALIGASGARLERARVPLRPGEYVLAAVITTVALGVWLVLFTDTLVAALVAVVVVPFGFVAFLDGKGRWI